MSLLRFQQPCPRAIDEARLGATAIVRELEAVARAAGRSGRQSSSDLLRRRHAIADERRGGGARARRHRAAVARGERCRNHAGSQPHQRRCRRASAIIARPASTGFRMGVQALNDAALKVLGRLHERREAKAASGWRLEIFPRVSFDLIYARPDQTLRGLEARTERGAGFRHRTSVALPAHHRAGTAFATLARRESSIFPTTMRPPSFTRRRRRLRTRRPSGLRDLQSCAARRGVPAQSHLLALWRLCGRRAGRPWPSDVAGRRLASQAERLPERWLAEVEQNGSSLVLTEISRAEAAREHLLMAIRLDEGLDLGAYRARWGTAPCANRIAALEQAGLVSCTGGRLTATPRGRLVLNSIVRELADLPEPQPAD